VDQIARGMRAQFNAILVTEPEIFGVRVADPGGWHYLRIRFRVWPGQGGIIENTFHQRVILEMRNIDPNYMNWMVNVVYRVT
jgi:moderate conductance mechanosensitive channel